MDAVGAMRAAGHPVRRRLLTLLGDGEESSPAALAPDVPDASLGVVSYHVLVLAESGLLTPTRSVDRGGVTEHFYRLSPAGRTVLDAAEALERALS